MITDKLGSYAAAQRQIMPDVEHRSHRGSTIGPRIRICHSGDESG
jgi:putative transposase